MIRREVAGRYKGSILGLAWSFFHPVFMLAVYTFVFSEVFGSRWETPAVEHNRVDFAFILFVGMIVLSLFSEVLNRSPHLISSNVNYVKKVVFPLEILPVVAIGTALFHACISVLVLVVAVLLTNGAVHWTAALLPFVLLPLVTLSLGLSWLLASLGVFLRDVGQVTGIATTALLFLSPVFYPVSAVPESFRSLMMLNPLTFIIEQARGVLMWGKIPDWSGLVVYLTASVIVAWMGWVWFQKTRKGFADVL